MTTFNLEILESRRLLSFSAPIASGGAGDSVIVGSFNADAFDDVAVFAGTKVSVRLSNGDGTFRRGATLSGMKGGPVSISTEDFNGDGRPDIRATGISVTKKGSTITRTHHTTTWLGNGDGTFGAASVISAQWQYGGPGDPYNPYGTSGDFNGDGILDGASIDGRAAGNITVYFYNAVGTYQHVDYPAGANPGAIAAGNFNGDGVIDIVVVNSPSTGKAAFSVLLNDGNW